MKAKHSKFLRVTFATLFRKGVWTVCIFIAIVMVQLTTSRSMFLVWGNFLFFFMVHYPALHIFRLKNTYDIQLLFFLERILNYTFKIILMGNVIIRICYDWTRQWHVKIKITSHRWRISKLIKYILTFWKRFRMGREIVCFILKERKSYTKL